MDTPSGAVFRPQKVENQKRTHRRKNRNHTLLSQLSQSPRLPLLQKNEPLVKHSKGNSIDLSEPKPNHRSISLPLVLRSHNPTNLKAKHSKRKGPKSSPKHNFTLDQSIKDLKKLPIICKSNFLPELALAGIQNTMPMCSKTQNTLNCDESGVQMQGVLRTSWMEETPRPLEFHFNMMGDTINRILGNQKGDFISKRFEALNKKLLKNQKLYVGKEWKFNNLVDWRY